jgi:hypothetical protein
MFAMVIGSIGSLERAAAIINSDALSRTPRIRGHSLLPPPVAFKERVQATPADLTVLYEGICGYGSNCGSSRNIVMSFLWLSLQLKGFGHNRHQSPSRARTSQDAEAASRGRSEAR